MSHWSWITICHGDTVRSFLPRITCYRYTCRLQDCQIKWVQQKKKQKVDQFLLVEDNEKTKWTNFNSQSNSQFWTRNIPNFDKKCQQKTFMEYSALMKHANLLWMCVSANTEYSSLAKSYKLCEIICPGQNMLYLMWNACILHRPKHAIFCLKHFSKKMAFLCECMTLTSMRSHRYPDCTQ